MIKITLNTFIKQLQCFQWTEKKLKISLIKVHFIDLYSFHVMIVLYEKIFSIEKLNLAWNKQTNFQTLTNFI